MNNKEFDHQIEKLLGFPYTFSPSTYYKFQHGELTVKEAVDRLKKIRTKPYFWIENGYANGLEEANDILKMSHPTICRICNSVFDKDTVAMIGKTLGCSIECQQKSNKLHSDNLIKSKSQYSYWDPIQYAKRHKISVEEATTFLDELKTVTSKRTIGYWIKRGYSETEAKMKVSEVQKQNSPRCVDYWTYRGSDLEEAKHLVSEFQAESARLMSAQLKANNHTRCCGNTQFWTQKGFSETEARSKAFKIQSDRSRKFWDNYRDDIRFIRPCYIEYWENKFPSEDYVSMYENFMRERYSKRSNRSNIADEFCVNLAQHFPGNHIYHTVEEFGKYIPGHGYRLYDFVDLTTNVCVEFNGNYWHEPDSEYDQIKCDFMRQLGFRVFIVWESDYRFDKEKCIRQLVEEITNENQ